MLNLICMQNKKKHKRRRRKKECNTSHATYHEKFKAFKLIKFLHLKKKIRKKKREEEKNLIEHNKSKFSNN